VIGVPVEDVARTDRHLGYVAGSRLVATADLLRWLGRPSGEETDRVINSRSGWSAPAGYRFPREVIAVAVRWYLRYGLSYRDIEELLAERGVAVDHVTVYRWVQTFTRSSSTPRVRHATRRVIGGWSTTPTSRSPDGGATYTEASTNMAKLWM
jgi:hypothetical protein